MDQKTFQTTILNEVTLSYTDALITHIENERKVLLKAIVNDRTSTHADLLFLFATAVANNNGALSIGERKELGKLQTALDDDLHTWLVMTNRLISLLSKLKTKGKDMGKLKEFTPHLG